MLLLTNNGDDIDLAHLRELRLWHWLECLKHRSHERRYEKEGTPGWVIKASRDKANFHMGAVQALNDLFAIGDTAEKDAEQKEGPKT